MIKKVILVTILFWLCFSTMAQADAIWKIKFYSPNNYRDMELCVKDFQIIDNPTPDSMFKHNINFIDEFDNKGATHIDPDTLEPLGTCPNSDIDNDGEPDHSDPDIDGDGVNNENDTDPYNPAIGGNNGDGDNGGDGGDGGSDGGSGGPGGDNGGDGGDGGSGGPGGDNGDDGGECNADADSDGDGVKDCEDICPLDRFDGCACPIPDPDLPVLVRIINLFPQSPEAVRIPSILAKVGGEGSLSGNLLVELYNGAWQYLALLLSWKVIKSIL